MDRLNQPPSTTTPYLLPSFSGELWTIPTSNSVMRLLVTGKETANAFAVVSTGGTYDKPIGFHFLLKTTIAGTIQLNEVCYIKKSPQNARKFSVFYE